MLSGATNHLHALLLSCVLCDDGKKSMNMFAKTKATSIKEYLAAVPKDRRELIDYLHAFIQKAAPKLKPHFAHNMLGYGSFPYKNYKKEMVEWPIVALANQKNYVSIYICALDGKQYLAEKFKKDLGNVQVGKSCIRLKKIEDVNLPILKKVIQTAAKSPGFLQEK